MKIFTNFLNESAIERYSCSTSKGGVFVGICNRTTKGLSLKPVLERVLKLEQMKSTQQQNKIIKKTFFSQINTPIQPSFKKNEVHIYHNLLNKRRKLRPMFILVYIVGAADKNMKISNGVETNWSNRLFLHTEVIEDIFSTSHKLNPLE